MVNRSKITGAPNGERAGSAERRKNPRPVPRMQFEWVDAVTDEQWVTYRDAIRALKASGVRFLLGGGFALATYIGHWRNTKDIDFYIMQADRDKAVEALTKAGFQDYFSQLP